VWPIILHAISAPAAPVLLFAALIQLMDHAVKDSPEDADFVAAVSKAYRNIKIPLCYAHHLAHKLRND